MSPLGPGDLILCAGPLVATPLIERIPMAAEAGFNGLSLFPGDLEGARSAGVGDAELRKRLADHGLCIAEVEPLMSWLPGAEPGAGQPTEADFHDIAEAVEARSMGVACFGSEPVGRDAWVEAFAGLCDRAAERGLLVHLDDVQPRPEPDLVAETLHRRLLPGEGAADVVALVRALDAGGCQAPIGVEVFSDALLQEGPRELVHRSAEAARRVLAPARP